LKANLVHQTPARQICPCILVAYFTSMSRACCRSRRWNKSQFLHENKYCLFKFQSVILRKYSRRRFELWPSVLCQKIRLRSWNVL